MFEAAQWQPDRMLLNGWVYRIEHTRKDDWDPAQDHFRFYKLRPLVDAYERFFSRYGGRFERVLELGLWDGGSLAFWFDALRPRKMVGVDIEARSDSAYFRRFVDEQKLHERVSTHWRTDQADGAALRRIVAREFDGPLDLVFDDASHLYAPTKSSFETLFPLLRPGGLYIIEDWAWKHWAAFALPRQWSPNANPTRLVVELAEAAGTDADVVAALHVHQGFVAVERGARALASPFRLDEHIHRRREPLTSRIFNRIVWGPERAALARVKQRILG